ncbi:transglutaminase family protein [Devosia aquimaris]|uniref:transglutaminase family protein n=1 Tax=Devosia aquimaris TaxID=2866214 RepID=UPI001CD0A525|nr:transglutaminase family protein [Devosia sp. CJK-A8-3]
MRISIEHQLSVTPPAGTVHAVLQVMLTPINGPSQSVDSWSVEMPGIGNAARFADAYGNSVHLVNQARPEGTLLVTVRGEVTTTDRHGVLGRVSGEPVAALYKRVTALTRPPVTLYGKFRSSKDNRIDILHALMARVGETLGVADAGEQSQTQMSADGAQSQSQGTASGQTARPPASAADLAHAFIGSCRALDIPARYVTGYLAPGGPEAEDKLTGFHAWAEAFDDRLGWIGFDPTLQLCPTDRHVRLAAGLDGLTTTPLRIVPAGDGVAMQEAVVSIA